MNSSQLERNSGGDTFARIVCLPPRTGSLNSESPPAPDDVLSDHEITEVLVIDGDEPELEVTSTPLPPANNKMLKVYKAVS